MSSYCTTLFPTSTLSVNCRSQNSSSTRSVVDTHRYRPYKRSTRITVYINVLHNILHSTIYSIPVVCTHSIANQTKCWHNVQSKVVPCSDSSCYCSHSYKSRLCTSQPFCSTLAHCTVCCVLSIPVRQHSV
jgi:hypothetical protein